ncbi:MAG: family transporter [Phycisphaerales bacterium]|nr:family transporter [Phycisphaerales bacterium]
MQRFNIRWLALLAICLIALYLCWLIVFPFLDVIIWSVVLAIVAYPFYERVRRRVTSPKWAASLITVMAIIVIGLLPIAILAVSAASQVPEGIDAAQDGINKVKQFLAGDSRVAHYIHQYVNTDQLGEQIKGVAGPAIQNSLKVAGGVLGILVKIAFTMFALFYLLRDADAIGRATMNLLPLTEAQALKVFHRCREVIKASVQGVMVIAAVQGVIGGISFVAVGIPSSVLWGFVMFITALVPAVGAAIVWLPAAAILAINGHYWKAGIIVFVGGVIVSSIDNVLRPRLVGEKAGLHDLVIFFSVLGGLQAFGVAGLFIGPVVVALTLSIIEVFKQMNPVGAVAAQPEKKMLVASDGTELITAS